MGRRKGKSSRLLCGLMSVIVGLSVFGSTAAAGLAPVPAMSVQVHTSQSTVAPGDEITVTVRLEDMDQVTSEGLSDVYTAITFDSRVFTASEYLTSFGGRPEYRADAFINGTDLAFENFFFSTPLLQTTPSDLTLPDHTALIYTGVSVMTNQYPITTSSKDMISFKLKVRSDAVTGLTSIGLNPNETRVTAYKDGLTSNLEPDQIVYEAQSLNVEAKPALHETDIVLIADTTTLTVGEQATVTPMVILSNNTSAPVKGDVIWTTSDPMVATVSNGEVTAVAPGNVRITAKYGSFVNDVSIMVVKPALSVSSVFITPSPVSVPVGSTATVTANARYSDDTTAVLASGVTWTSDNIEVAKVSDTGVITGVGTGPTLIRATYQEVSTAIFVAVTPAVISLAATPETVDFKVGETAALTAIARYSNGSTDVNVTSSADFLSENTDVVTVSETGVLTAVGAGKAEITVQFAGQTVKVAVNVSTAIIPAPVVTPEPGLR